MPPRSLNGGVSFGWNTVTYPPYSQGTLNNPRAGNVFPTSRLVRTKSPLWEAFKTDTPESSQMSEDKCTPPDEDRTELGADRNTTDVQKSSKRRSTIGDSRLSQPFGGLVFSVECEDPLKVKNSALRLRGTRVNWSVESVSHSKWRTYHGLSLVGPYKFRLVAVCSSDANCDPPMVPLKTAVSRNRTAVTSDRAQRASSETKASGEACWRVGGPSRGAPRCGGPSRRDTSAQATGEGPRRGAAARAGEGGGLDSLASQCHAPDCTPTSHSGRYIVTDAMCWLGIT
ncbi:hypothetical protein AAG570_007518 [Ranatra chinensis]|uniref:Uncharacterized protein n=1 Tax=Ranatra chinensis TaxID=642074 RepID=A0ABD0Y937_9HEMI